jgi:succinoglycan biosynthesis transport protein ExoP
MEFLYLFRALLRRKWIILICVVVSSLIAFILTRNVKKSYRSTAQLSTRFTVSDQPNGAVNYIQSEFKFGNVIENITSPNVLSLVSYHLLLHDLQSPNPFTVLNSKQQADANKADKQRVIQNLSAHLESISMLSTTDAIDKQILSLLYIYGYGAEALTGSLKVDRYQKTDYINIDYKSGNPNLSAFVVNTLCDEFRRFYNQTEMQHTDNNVISLDSIVKAKRATLDQKQQIKEQFMANNKLVDVNLEGSSKLAQLSAYENQLIEENSALRNASYRLKQLDDLIRNARNRGQSAVEDPATTPKTTTKPAQTGTSANSEYIRLRKQYNDLNNEYIAKGGNDPEMKKRLDAILQSMSRLNVSDGDGGGSITPGGGGGGGSANLDQLTQRRIDAAAEVEASNNKIAGIQAKIDQLRSGLSGMASKGANLDQFDKDIQLASAEYTAAKDQLNMALNARESLPDFKQTLIGEPPLGPEPSKRLLIVIVSGLGAFIIAALVIIFIEFFDNSIRSPSQFQRLTGLRLLGAVNRINLKGQENVLKKIAKFDEEEKARASTFLELLRKLRYEVEASNKKIFLFTSTEPGQGKTMIVQALSYILSLGKKKVLIIDTNFCNNDLTKNINAEPVLEKYDLNGHSFDRGAFRRLLTPTNIERVDIIGCAGGDYTPSEILPKNHLLKHLTELKEEYDFILLEGAPLNEYTDTKELESFVEGIVAVFSAESSLTAIDKESIRFLHDNRDKFLGAILNKVETFNLEL